MARKRMVDSKLASSLTVSQLPVPARYGWVLLWSYFDDYGRGVDDARLIKAACWPLDDKYTAAKVEADLKAYAELGLICRYYNPALPGRFLHSPKWTDYQKVQHPAKSTLPVCPLHDLHEDVVSRSGFLHEELRSAS